MKTFKIASFLTAFLLVALMVNAQVDIISVKDFIAMKDVVLVDANKAKNYNVNHIKGAINIDPSDFFVDSKTSGTIKSADVLAAYFGEKGINENSKVVVYDDGSQKYSTRVYWVLKYLGATDVKLLHKDANEFRANRVVLTAAPSKLAATKFNPRLNPDIFVDFDYVKAHKDQAGFVMADFRTPDEFTGAKNGEVGIPGAININHEDLLTDSGAFKSVDELKALAAKHNITADTELIVYCRTGIRAAVGFVAFKNLVGLEKVKLYDGSLLEWIKKAPAN